MADLRSAENILRSRSTDLNAEGSRRATRTALATPPSSKLINAPLSDVSTTDP
jgi:hypothetical protein